MERYLKVLTLIFFSIGLFQIIPGLAVMLYYKTSILSGSWIAGLIVEYDLQESEALRKLIVYFPMFIASIGLYFKQKWGRIVAILWSVLNFANFPIGTVFGILGLWVLLKKEIKRKFNVDESKFI